MLYCVYVLTFKAMGLALERAIAAFSTIPTLQDCCLVAALLGIYAAIAIPAGFRLKFIQRQNTGLSWPTQIVVILAVFLSPGFTEEIFFRVLLLPHPSENTSWETQFWMGLLSLTLFIVYHPLNAYTFFPAGRQVFLQPAFLLLATLLGILCTITYLASGSFWLPVFAHWLIVVVWLLFLGGYGKLYAGKIPKK